MNKQNDVIGLALLDYLAKKGKENIQITSNVTEEDIIPIEYLFRTEEELPKIEGEALQLCKGKVLDVGAGSGTHSLILQEKGVDVTAIDISEGAVEVMKQRGVKSAKCINFFDLKEERYETLLLMMNGIGIAGSLKGLEDLLIKAKDLISPDGQILLDSSDIQYLFMEEDGSVWMDLNKTYYGEVTYQMKYKEAQTEPFNWLFIDFAKLDEIATSLGWCCELVVEGEHYDYLAKLELK